MAETDSPDSPSSGPEASPVADATPAPNPTATTPDPEASGPGLMDKAAALAKKGLGMAAEAAGDQLTKITRKRQKEAEETENVDKTKMDPMMQLYTQLGESIAGLKDAIADRLSDWLQKGIDEIAEAVSEEKAVPQADAPTQTTPQPAATNPAPTDQTSGPQVGTTDTNAKPDAVEPVAETEQQVSSSMTPLPDQPPPTQAVEMAVDASPGYQAKSGADVSAGPSQNLSDDDELEIVAGAALNK
ncbi:hypothetical protein [uncultured Legionella sp.]|uniref:hypothetical protein n=1 Tax=uncultured Legionella sp. TaxID=210934 RepID=UPI00260206E2|nr:hypothetical protein [uncultured Legionella sp.]